MARLTLEDLGKHTYTDILIEKINNRIPLLIYPESKKVFFTVKMTKEMKSLLESLGTAVSTDDYTELLKEGPRLKQIFVDDENKKYSLSDISKENVKIGNTRKGDANSTKLQEEASLRILELLIKDKRKYKLEDIAKIYPDVLSNDLWQISYEAQYNTFVKIIKKYKLSKITIFNRDGGFMDFITKKVKKLGFSQKDAWNPADIWLIEDNSVQREIEKTTLINIEHLNNIMTKMLDDGRLCGISLKMTKKTATFEEVNIKNIAPVEYPFIDGRVTLDFKKDKFVNDEFSYNLKYSDSTAVINAQVRMYPKKQRSNVQVSYKVKGAKAEMGKVPAALRNASLNMYNYKFPTGKNIPTNAVDFEKKKRLYTKMIKTILSKKIITMDIKNAEEGIENILKALEVSDRYAKTEVSTKLQGLELAYYFSKLKKKDLTSLVTEWGFLAQKKGNKFGPFIKVY